MSNLPIPSTIAARIIAFLMPERSGSIVLHVKDGRIIKVDFNESLRVHDELTVLREPLLR